MNSEIDKILGIWNNLDPEAKSMCRYLAAFEWWSGVEESSLNPREKETLDELVPMDVVQKLPHWQIAEEYIAKHKNLPKSASKKDLGISLTLLEMKRVLEEKNDNLFRYRLKDEELHDFVRNQSD